LQPSGLTSSNYNIQFVAGDYQIVPAQTLIVKVANATVTYGNTATLVPTSVEYLDGTNLLKSLTQTAASGNTYTYSDGVGGSATFTLTATGSTSTSSNLKADAIYSTTGINFSKVSDNFVGTPIYTGSLAVTKRALTATTTTVSKVYDGSTSMAGLTIDLSNLVTGDLVGATGVGAFSQSNVGSSLGYSISNLSLNGADKNNYYLSGGTSLSGSNGAITARPITITADSNQSKIYGNANPVTLGYTAEVSSAGRGLVQGDSFTGSLTRASGENVGNYAIAQGTVANSNYAITYVPANFAITPRPITLTASSATKVYGDADPAFSVSITSGSLASIAVTDTLAEVSGTLSRSAGENVGHYGIALGTGANAGTKAGNYSLTYVGDNLSITPAALTVTGVNTSVTYTGLAQTNGSATVAGLKNSESFTISGYGTGTNYSASAYADNLLATPAAGTLATNYTISYTNGGISIGKANATVTANSANVTYTGLAQSVTGFTATGLVNNQTISVLTGVSASGATGTNVATYTNTVSGTANNYNLTFVNGSLVIGKANATVTANSANVTYSGQAQSVSGFTATGLLNGQTTAVLTGVSASGATGTNAATYTNTVTGTDSNYNLTLVNGSLVIGKAALSVTGANTAVTYTGVAQTNSAATVSGLKGSDNFTVSGYGNGTNYSASAYADNLVATPALGTLADNYNISYTNGGISIGKAGLVVTADNKTRIYGDANPALTYTVTGYVNGEGASTHSGSATLATTAGLTSNVGNVAITAAANNLTSSNYSFSYANGTMAITPAALSVTGVSTSVIYSGVAQTNGAATVTGLKNSDSFTISGYGTGTNYSATAYADTLLATQASGTLASNYNISYTNGGLSIGKANATVTANSANVTYTGLTQSVSGFTAAGLVNGETTTVLTGVTASGATGTNAATYTNTVTGTDNNYNLTFVNGSLVIGKAGLVVTADNKTRIYGDANPALTYTVTGYVNGENSATHNGSPTIATTAGLTSNVGNVAITATANNLTANNYSFSYANGSLAITPAALTVTGANTSVIYSGVAQTNSAATVTGLKNSDSFSISGYGTGTNYRSTAYADTLLATQSAGTLASNYNITYTNGGLSIGKANATLTANSSNVTYTGLAQSVSGYTATGLVNNQTISVLTGVTASGATGTNAATYTNTVTGTDNNYNLTLVNGSLVIGKANATVTANSSNVTYTGLAQSVSGFTATGLVNGETTSVLSGVTASGATGTNAATYTNTVTGTDSNYNLNLVNGSLVIGKANATLTANSANVTYTGLAQSVSGYTATGLVNNQTISVLTGVTASGATGTNAATYTNTVTGTDNNYNLTLVNGSLVIGKANATVTANSSNVTYTGLAQSVSGFTATGLVNGETTSVLSGVTASGATGTNAATYINTVTGTDSNYNLTLVNGSLVIGKAGLVVTADNKTRVYGSANPSLTYTLTGFVNSENASVISGAPTLTTNANTNTGVGDVPIATTVGNFSASNYSFTAANGILTVTPKQLIVSAVDQSTTYGTALDLGTNNTGANRYTTSGLINSDTVNAVVLNQNGNTTVPSGQAAGIYAGSTNGIIVSSATGSGLTNYAITYAPASLTIHQKALTIAGQSVINKVYDAGTFATINSASASLVGVVGTDAVSLNTSGTYGTFVDANVANGIGVTVAGNTLAGAASSNYTIVQPTGLTANITPAPLTVTARADAKFVTQSDTTGYNGATISGLVGNETSAVLGGSLTITRTNAAQNNANANPYLGVLQPSGLTSSNYSIQFVAGDYTIVPAETLLVRVANATVTYGSAATFVPTSVEYLTSGSVLKTLTQTSASGNTYTYADGLGGSATFTLAATGNPSTSGNLQANASYATTGINFSKVSNNFVGTPIYTGSLSVTRKGITASTTNVSKVYDGNTSMLGLTIDLTNLVSGDLVGAAGVGAFSQSNVGNNLGYSVSNLTLNGADKNNYYLTGGTSFSGNTGTITARPINITADSNQSKIYGNANPVVLTYSAEASSGSRGLVAGDSFTGALSRASGENVGSYAINQGTVANSNYAINYVPANFVITPRPITLSANSSTKVYSEIDPTISVSVTSGSLASIAVNDTLAEVTGTLSRSAGENVGNYNISLGSGINAGAKAGNYSVTYVSNSLAVTPAPLSVTGANRTTTYSGIAQTNSAATIVGLKFSDSFTISGYGTGTNYSANAYADTLLATPVAGTLAANYNISYTNGGLSIGKANATVTANSANVTYTGLSQSVAGFTATGLLNGETTAVLTGVTTSGATGTNAATYINTITGTSNNYNLTFVNGSQVIGKANATVTANSTNLTYSGVAQSVSGFTATGLVNGETTAVLRSVIASGATGTNVGTYTNTVSGTDSNYNLAFANGSLVIGKANATVTANSANVTYTGLAQSVSGFTAKGLLNGETNSVLTGVTASSATGTNAATYINTVTGTDSNYNLTLVNGELVIGKAGLVVTADNKTRVYGDANPSLTYTVTGFVNNETSLVISGLPSLATTAALVSNVGNVAITAAANNLTANNYKFTYANGVMDIKPRPINVSADANQSKIMFSADPILTYTIEPSSVGRGIVGADLFSGNLARSTGEDIGTNYTILPGTLANPNYSINFIPSTFEIKAPPTTFSVGVLMTSIVTNNDFQTSAPVVASTEAPKVNQVNVTQTYAANSQALTVITAQVPVAKINDFIIKIPDQIAKNITSSGARVTAQMVDGRELPSWLKFDPQTLEFKAQSNANGAMTTDVVRVSIKFGSETIIVEIKTIDILGKI
jgi:hypothetical protein